MGDKYEAFLNLLAHKIAQLVKGYEEVNVIEVTLAKSWMKESGITEAVIDLKD